MVGGLAAADELLLAEIRSVMSGVLVVEAALLFSMAAARPISLGRLAASPTLILLPILSPLPLLLLFFFCCCCCCSSSSGPPPFSDTDLVSGRLAPVAGSALFSDDSGEVGDPVSGRLGSVLCPIDLGSEA